MKFFFLLFVVLELCVGLEDLRSISSTSGEKCAVKDDLTIISYISPEANGCYKFNEPSSEVPYPSYSGGDGLLFDDDVGWVLWSGSMNCYLPMDLDYSYSDSIGEYGECVEIEVFCGCSDSFELEYDSYEQEQDYDDISEQDYDDNKIRYYPHNQVWLKGDISTSQAGDHVIVIEDGSESSTYENDDSSLVYLPKAKNESSTYDDDDFVSLPKTKNEDDDSSGRYVFIFYAVGSMILIFFVLRFVSKYERGKKFSKVFEDSFYV